MTIFQVGMEFSWNSNWPQTTNANSPGGSGSFGEWTLWQQIPVELWPFPKSHLPSALHEVSRIPPNHYWPSLLQNRSSIRTVLMKFCYVPILNDANTFYFPGKFNKETASPPVDQKDINILNFILCSLYVCFIVTILYPLPNNWRNNEKVLMGEWASFSCPFHNHDVVFNSTDSVWEGNPTLGEPPGLLQLLYSLPPKLPPQGVADSSSTAEPH